MFGQITDLPTLRSYEQARAHYESITPIRGSNNLRPICDTTNGRRKKHMRIELRPYTTPVGTVPSVACILYGTAVVTFAANGEIVLDNGGYASNTTHGFIEGIFSRSYYDTSVRAYGKGGQTVIEAHKPSGKSVTVMDSRTPTITLMRRSDDVNSYFEVVGDAAVQVGYYLKRAPMGMRRKEIEKFTKLALAAAKMVDPADYKGLTWGGYRTTAAEVYAMMTDQNQWNDAIDLLMSDAIETRTEWTSGGNWERKRSINTKKLKTKIDDVLKYMFVEDLFEERETNNPLSNENGKYLEGKEARIL
jgi:hypothetical protein